jgi:gelsolin
MEFNNNSNGKDSLTRMSKRLESLTIKEDVKEGEPEDEEGLMVYPYHRLIKTSTDPAPDIDVTKREVQHYI